MYVKDHMTVNPVTITPDTSVSKALDLMQKGDFHRLPVVDENGKLKGLITEGIVTDSTGSNKTSLSIYELNYLLSRMNVGELMIRDVVTITQEKFVEQAAEMMLDNSINVLPVVDSENKVIGIITEKDIFQTFVDLLGTRQQGTKFVIAMDDVPGEAAKVFNLLAENDANVEAFGVYHTDRGTECFVKATGTIEVEAMTKIFKDENIRVSRVIQTTKEGKTVEYDPEKI